MSAFAYFRAARADKAVYTSKRVANKDAGHAGAHLVLSVIARQQSNDSAPTSGGKSTHFWAPASSRKSHTRNTDTSA